MRLPKTPLLAVDCVVMDKNNRLLLVRRKNAPFQGCLALPGGFVEIGETVEAGARRELKEEAGIDAGELLLVGVYSDPKRDPRGHVCSIAFLARVDNVEPKAADDADTATWVADPEAVPLAFDHLEIVKDAMRLVYAR
jgi:8-oxo-dGTP diphosphatase